MSRCNSWNTHTRHVRNLDIRVFIEQKLATHKRTHALMHSQWHEDAREMKSNARKISKLYKNQFKSEKAQKRENFETFILFWIL